MKICTIICEKASTKFSSFSKFIFLKSFLPKSSELIMYGIGRGVPLPQRDRALPTFKEAEVNRLDLSPNVNPHHLVNPAIVTETWKRREGGRFRQNYDLITNEEEVLTKLEMIRRFRELYVKMLIACDCQTDILATRRGIIERGLAQIHQEEKRARILQDQHRVNRHLENGGFALTPTEAQAFVQDVADYQQRALRDNERFLPYLTLEQLAAARWPRHSLETAHINGLDRLLFHNQDISTGRPRNLNNVPIEPPSPTTSPEGSLIGVSTSPSSGQDDGEEEEEELEDTNRTPEDEVDDPRAPTYDPIPVSPSFNMDTTDTRSTISNSHMEEEISSPSPSTSKAQEQFCHKIHELLLSKQRQQELEKKGNERVDKTPFPEENNHSKSGHRRGRCSKRPIKSRARPVSIVVPQRPLDSCSSCSTPHASGACDVSTRPSDLRGISTGRPSMPSTASGRERSPSSDQGAPTSQELNSSSHRMR